MVRLWRMYRTRDRTASWYILYTSSNTTIRCKILLRISCMRRRRWWRRRALDARNPQRWLWRISAAATHLLIYRSGLGIIRSRDSMYSTMMVLRNRLSSALWRRRRRWYRRRWQLLTNTSSMQKRWRRGRNTPHHNESASSAPNHCSVLSRRVGQPYIMLVLRIVLSSHPQNGS
jgi:hypothetical protein